MERKNKLLKTLSATLSQKRELIGTEYVLVATIIEDIKDRMSKLQNHYLDLLMKEL